MKYAYAFISFFILYVATAHAQTMKPTTNSPIKLELDEYGRVKQISSYGLIKSAQYHVKLTYDAPTKTHEKFIKDLGKQFLETYKILTDEFNPLTSLYLELWGPEFQRMKDDLKKLGALLTSSNADANLNAQRSAEFPYLGGKDFLYKNLFGDVFTVSLNGNSQTTSYKNPVLITANNLTPDDNRIKITVTKADFYKQFIQAYYKKIKSESDSLFNNLRAKAFYEDSVKRRDSLIEEIAMFKTKLDTNSLYICEPELSTLQTLLAKVNYNFFIRILKSHWMKSWIWYTGGTLPINPLGFTAEQYVPLQRGFNKELAAEYDSYRASAIEQMKTGTLSEAKINYAAFDSLMKQRGRGQTVFSYEESDENRKKENKQKADSEQKVFATTTSLVVEIVNDKNKVVYRSFNAAKNLQGSGPEDMPTLSTKTNVKLVAYNLKNGEDFTKKENPVDIADQSEAITGINEVADMAALLSGNVVGLPLKVAGVLNGIRDPQKRPSAFSIAPDIPTEPIENSGEGMVPESTLPLGVMHLKSSTRRTILKDSRTGKLYNLGDSIRQRLVRQKIVCTYFSDVVIAHVDRAMDPVDKKVRQDTVARSLREILGNIGAEIQRGIEEAYVKFKDLETTAVLNKLDLQLALLAINSNYKAYALPPSDLNADTDTTPQFRNKIDSFARETKAKEKNTEIALVNKKGETIAQVKDSYKTAPPHWIAPSIGIGYLAHSFRRSDATISNGVISNTADEERVRLIAGVHLYPRAIILADNRNVFKLKGWDLVSRFGLFLGLSFPKPLYNLHGGMSVDIWTGVKLTSGVHLYRYTEYKLLNNTISDQKSTYQYNGGFVSLQLDPSSLMKLLGVIK